MEILPVRDDELMEIFSLEQSIEGESGASIAALRARRQMFEGGFLVAREAGRIVGYIESCLWNRVSPKFDPHADFFAGQHCADGKILYIIFVGVAHNYRRQGIANTLIRAIMPVARKYGAQRVQAVTRVNLLPLYTNLGFTVLREMPSFLPGNADDLRLMELDLE